MAIINNSEKFKIEGDSNIYTKTATGIAKIAPLNQNQINAGVYSNIPTLSKQDVSDLWISMLDAGSNRYAGQFTNEYSNETVQASKIADYLGREPLGTLPTRAQELAGNTQGLTSGSALSGNYPIAGQNLSSATAPTNASQVNNNVGNTNLPTNIPGMGNIAGATSATAGTQSYIDTQAQIAKDRQEQIRKQMELLNAQTKPLLDRLMGSLSPEQTRLQAQQQTGINPEEYFADQKAKIAEIGTLTQEYNAAKAQMEQQLAQTQDKLGSMNFINNQTAQIQRNAAPVLNQLSANINAKSAVLQALQGNFAEAQNFVNQAVQDATAEYKYNADLYSTFYQLNKDAIETLDAPYKEAYTAALNLAQSTYEQSLKDKTKIGELMIDPALRNAGITMNDTIEQAYAKASAVAGPNYVASQAAIHGGSGSSSSTTSTIKFTNTEQKNYDAFKSEIASYNSKEEALNDLQANKSAIITKIGQKGYDQLEKDINATFGGTSGGSTSGGFTLTSGNLKQGSSGDNVKALQQALGISADGIFGSQTKAAVIAFQKANGLTADGIVGPATAAKLGGGIYSSTPVNINQAISSGGLTVDGISNFLFK